MNILHVVAIYPTEENPQSGIFIKSQIESLKNEGVTCDVFLLKGEGKSKYIKNIKRLRSFLLDRKYDIVHAHFAYSGWTARMATGLPLVVSYMGGDIYGVVNKNGRYTLRTKLFHKTSTYLLPRITSFSIVKSSRMAKEFSVTNVSVIPNGVDLEIFHPMKVRKKELGLSDDKKYVLFASNPDKSEWRSEKRYDIADEAINKLKERLPEAELIWIKMKTANEVAKYLNAVDCLLLTSEHEGSPNVVKEAIACNLPVVSRDVGDVAERIDGVQNCHLVSNVPADIADTLYETLIAGMRAKNGFEKIRELSIQKIARRIQDVYQKILN